MVEFSGGLFQITPKGQPFVRSVASAFDGYFGTGVARHSLAV
jgi:oxygen-independent coproporphyrinogen-3 oxidase